MPLIGVTTSATPDRPRATGPERAHLNRAYLTAVQQAGGVPVLLPPYLEPRAFDALWDQLDGLVLTGGGDVDPARFGEAPHPELSGVSRACDELEIELVERALHQGLPLLAICRGLQVLNVALGGSLHQHVPDVFGTAIAHHQREPRPEATHDVKLRAADGSLAPVLGTLELRVNSFHHQAVSRLGRGLREVARAPDGAVEALELPGARGLVLAVQWHPEEMVASDEPSRRLFAALVDAART